jgi:hypothetical protein
MNKHIAPKAESKEEVDLKYLMSKYTIDGFASGGLGVKINSFFMMKTTCLGNRWVQNKRKFGLTI